MVRKIRSVLAWRIEQNLTKDRILTLCLNKIPSVTGHSGSAPPPGLTSAEVKDPTLDEIAIIAGLPKAPSMLNPIRSPERAFRPPQRGTHRMLETGKITQVQYDEASRMPVKARYHGAGNDPERPYLSEMVRQKMVEQFGEDAYNMGLHVYTTVTAKRQRIRFPPGAARAASSTTTPATAIAARPPCCEASEAAWDYDRIMAHQWPNSRISA